MIFTQTVNVVFTLTPWLLCLVYVLEQVHQTTRITHAAAATARFQQNVVLMKCSVYACIKCVKISPKLAQFLHILRVQCTRYMPQIVLFLNYS